MADNELRRLATTWRTRADELAPFAPAAATAFARAADELTAALAVAHEALVDLGEAARLSGYSRRRLRELVSSKRLPNRGRPGRPAFRVCDLPRRPGRGDGRTGSGYDPVADAADLLARARRDREVF